MERDVKYTKAVDMNADGVGKTNSGSFEESILLFSFVVSTINTEPCQTTRTIYLRNCELAAAALSNRAFSYLKLGKLEKALDDANAALQLRSRIRYETGHLKLCVDDCNLVLLDATAEDAELEVDEAFDMVKHATKLKRMCEEEIRFDETNEVVVDVNFGDVEDDADEQYWRPIATQAGAVVTFVPKDRVACEAAMQRYVSSMAEQLQPAQREMLRGFPQWFAEVLDQYILTCTYLDVEDAVPHTDVEGDDAVAVGSAAAVPEKDVRFYSALLLEAVHLHLRCITGDDAAFYSTIHTFGLECLPFQVEPHEQFWKKLTGQMQAGARKSTHMHSGDLKRRSFSQALGMVRQWRVGHGGTAAGPSAAMLFTVNALAFTMLIPQIDEAVRGGELLDFSPPQGAAAGTPLACPSSPLLVLPCLMEMLAALERRSSARDAILFFTEFVETTVPPELREAFSTVAAQKADYLPIISSEC